MTDEKNIVLIVDDQLANRELLRDYVEIHQLDSVMAEDGVVALEKLEFEQVDIVLLDLMMPRMDGFEVLKQIRETEAFSHLPVIIISALDELASITKGIEMGADDYLTKPFDPLILSARLKWALQKTRLHRLERKHRDLLEVYNHELSNEVARQVEEISSTHKSLIFALSKLAESRDQETGAHLERMREYCLALARRLAEKGGAHGAITDQFIQDLYAASALHDIGKVGIPDAILNKPGSLTVSEFAIMQKHTEIGGRTLREVVKQHPGNRFLELGIEIAEHHHEKWDGSGYPDGLAGENIPLAARILSLADVYDAMTSKRCYKEVIEHDEALEIMISERGTRFDPEILDAFVEIECEVTAIREKFVEEE